MKDNAAWLITGSANFTKGGMSENVELSLMVETMCNSPICNNIVEWFDSISKDNIIEIDNLSINQYEVKYNVFARINKKARKEISRELSKVTVLDLSKIAKYLKEYNSDTEVQDEAKKKKLNYIEAKQILNELISERRKSKKEFIQTFNKLINGLWHSDGLARGRTAVEKNYKKVIELIKLLKKQLKAKPETVYNIGYKKIQDIERFGVNKLTEILNTYKPEKFSVLNQLSVDTMKYLGFNLKRSAQSFTGKDYAAFNSILMDLNKHCHFSDLSQVDHFLNYIYWKHVKQKNK